MINDEWAARMVIDAQASPKYKHICADTLQAAALRELAHGHKRYADAENAFRKYLHQQWGSYVYAQYQRKAAELSAQTPIDHNAVLALHASSRERLPYYEAIYRLIWDITGPPSTLLDIACGLNPFSLPYMPQPPQTYIAYDIDGIAISLCNQWFAQCGLQMLAQCADVLQTPALLKIQADVAFVFKLLPLMPNKSKEHLSGLNTRFIVVSYPLQSLGGRKAGRAQHYETLAAQQLPVADIIWNGVIGNELFYIMTGKVAI